jgi:hypothetical protein
MKTDRIFKCDNRFEDGGSNPDETAYFIPVEVGSLKGSNSSITYTNGFCFESITFTYSQSGNEKDIGDVTITVDAEKPKSLFCKDWFLFGNPELQHVETFFFRGKHQVTFKNLNDDAKTTIQKEGIQIYMFCDGYIDTFISAFNTIKAFVGGLGTNPYLPIIGSHVPEYMEKTNLKFLYDSMNYTLEKRTIVEYDYDESLI